MTAVGIQSPSFGSEAAGSSPSKGTRRERRAEVLLHVDYCSFPRSRSDQRLRVGFTRDLSPSGMCIHVDTPERVGSLLRVTLSDFDERPTLESIARVAWASPAADRGFWIGLALLEPSRPRPIPARRRPRAGSSVEVA